MDFVVDASVAAAWLLPDERNETAELALNMLQNVQGFVPVVWQFEIRNIIVVADGRGRLQQANIEDVFGFAAKLPLVADADIDHMRTLELVRTFRLTYYDAAYLELASRRRLPLATFDKALISAAKQLDLLLDLS